MRVLDENGEPLSEATLRKYVQLGLLPRSRRVGQKGKHRGSRGIYPVEVIRRVDEIRRAMENGETLEELAQAAQAVRARLAQARVIMEEAVAAANTDLSGRAFDRSTRSSLKSGLTALTKESKSWLRDFERWSASLDRAERDVKRAQNGATRKNKTTARRRTVSGGA